MKIISKRFDELTTRELYEILKLRSLIFVVEQNCIYQDLDDIDYDSLHIYMCDEDNNITAYLRAFYKDKDVVQIGRVVTLEHKKGYGRELLEKSIHIIEKEFKATKIFLESQLYAVGFYEKFGFKVSSKEYLEDGIPHVDMEKIISESDKYGKRLS